MHHQESSNSFVHVLYLYIFWSGFKYVCAVLQACWRCSPLSARPSLQPFSLFLSASLYPFFHFVPYLSSLTLFSPLLFLSSSCPSVSLDSFLRSHGKASVLMETKPWSRFVPFLFLLGHLLILPRRNGRFLKRENPWLSSSPTPGLLLKPGGWGWGWGG